MKIQETKTMFFVFTTKDNEKTVINSNHIILVLETKKGLFVLCDDGNTFYCTETIDDLTSRSCCIDFS